MLSSADPRLNGIDTRNQRPSAYLFVVDASGELRGMESTNSGVFRARIGRVAPDGTTTDALVTRGLSPEGISAAGKGESEPLVSERDEASRAINRRVEIDGLS